VARIVIAGAGAIGASIAYHLALQGARDIVLCDVAHVASGSTGKAMGGVRQQFSTEAEVRLARASISVFERLGSPLFDQVGYLFLATSDEGLARLDERARLQTNLGVPVEHVDPSYLPGLRVDDVLGATMCRKDGVADPPGVTRHLVAEAVARGVELREETDALHVDGDVLVVACGPRSAEVASRRGVDLPVRPLCRQLIETAPLDLLPAELPMVIEEETGFHFRRRGERLVVAMVDPEPRWGFEERVDESVIPDRLERLRRRYPPAAETTIERAWAGLYDMTPDAHPIIGWVGGGVYAACGFSGHGFMQSPAVGEAVAAELLDLDAPFDLGPYRLGRFAADAVFPETLVL
jgi:glycine/D-amino acid oxidase-like deaminating enzyme